MVTTPGAYKANDDGQRDAGIVPVRPFWPLTSSPSSDAFDEEVITVGKPGARHRIYCARHGGGVHRWRYEGLGNGDLDDGEQTVLVRRGDGGQGIYCDTRWIERVGGGTQWEHNPNATAAVNLPIASKSVRACLAPCIHHRIEQDGSSARLTFGTIPMEWDAPGYQGATFDHGGHAHGFFLWHRMRNVKVIDVNWRGVAGVIRITDWEYFPREWNTADGAMFLYSNGGIAFGNQFGNDSGGRGTFYDPSNGLEAGPSEAEWLATQTGFWSIDGVPNGGQVTTNTGITWSTPFVAFADDVAGCVLETAEAGVSVGFIGQQERGAYRPGLRRPGYLQISQDRGDPGGTSLIGDDIHNGQGITIGHKSTISRAAGWIGRSYLLVLDQSSLVRAALRSLYAERLVQRGPDFSLVPPEIIADMQRDGLPRADEPA